MIDLSNIVSLTENVRQQGLDALNTSDLAIFTKATPIPEDYGNFRKYRTAKDVATDFGSDTTIYKMANAVFSQTPNIKSGNGSLIIIQLSASDLEADDVKNTALLRMEREVNFFGFMFDDVDDNFQGVAATVQSLNKVFFTASNDYTLVAGSFTNVQKANQQKTRCLFYGSSTALDALLFMASYAGRGLATNFNGYGTAFTMQLKDMVGILPDLTIDQTRYDALMTAGVDCYVDFGIPKLATSGANGWFDVVVYSIAIKVSYIISLFNSLATTPTKIAQTNAGLNLIIANATKDLDKFQTSGVLATGVKWTGEIPVPVPEDIFNLSIMQNGFHLWFDDINNQSQEEREQRKTPAGSLSVKFAGAFHHVQSSITLQE